MTGVVGRKACLVFKTVPYGWGSGEKGLPCGHIWDSTSVYHDNSSLTLAGVVLARVKLYMCLYRS